jgi:ABC-type amino acid transport substrate-binding protein
MFAGLIMISSFTAAITSQLTITRLEDLLAGPEDLRRFRVATVAGSTSEDYLDTRHIAHTEMASIEACLEALALRKTQAVVYDEAILRYYINEQYRDIIEVLPETFEQQQYGIVMPQGHPLREAINLAILDLLASSSYQDILFRYLGEQ